MVTWQQVQGIYTEYQSSKGTFRQAFNSSSTFMNFVASLLKGKNLDNPVSLQDRYQLVLQYFEIPKEKSNDLSARLGRKLARLCVNDAEQSTFTNFFSKLHQARLFTPFVFSIIVDHPERAQIPEEFTSIYPALNKTNAHISLLNLPKTTTLECYLGFLFNCVGNREKAQNWYLNAIRKGQTISELYFPRSSVSSAIAFSIAEIYKEGNEEITQNLNEATKFYGIAAKERHPQALFYLGDIAQTECEGSSADPVKAFDYYLQAAQLGITQAAPILNRLAEEHDALKLKLGEHAQTLWQKTGVSLTSEPTKPSYGQH